MNHDLEIAIEDAEFSEGREIDLFDAICALSTHEHTVAVLLDAFKQATIETELAWREIEQRADFRTRYHSRKVFFETERRRRNEF